MIFFVICVLLVAQQVSGVIYRMNASEFARLPDLFALDRYYPCLQNPGDTYCYVDAKLVLHTAYSTTHFNHTLVHRGLCVTQTCRDYLGNSTDLVNSIEACLNATLYRSHGLQARVLEDKVRCTKFDEPAGYDLLDYTIALALLAILALNVAGSLFDSSLSDGGKTKGGRVLLCFSFRRNWRRLRSAAGEGPDPRLGRLKCFTGLKTITTLLVILAHSPINAAIATSDPEYLENIYQNVVATFMFNGTLMIQTFFVISGFLLAYNLLLLGEKHGISWDMLPKGVVFRWLRLAPVNAVVLGFVATWQRHLGSGPIWKSVVGQEVDQCRHDWYYNLLYVHNYVDNSDCMPHTWYLGADMQLSVLGLMIFCLATSARVRKVAIAVAFIIGLLTPAIHTAVQNLNPILIVAPEVARNIFVKDPTFNNLYKRGHTNLVNYSVGLVLALVVYRLQQQKFDLNKYTKFLPLYYATVPFGVLIILSGVVLYIDGIQFPLAALAVYASAVKLLYGLALAVLIGGTIFKFENVYRGALEWSLWGPPGRLSYAAFLVHISVIRTVTGASGALLNNSFNQLIPVECVLISPVQACTLYSVVRASMAVMFFGVLSLSFMIAFPLWMLVEAPCGQLVKVCFYPEKKPEEKKTVHLTQNVEKETVTIKF